MIRVFMEKGQAPSSKIERGKFSWYAEELTIK